MRHIVVPYLLKWSYGKHVATVERRCGQMGTIVKCARCGSTEFDLHEFDTMMVLCEQLALFGLRCPRCDASVAAMCTIPPDMQDYVRAVALEVGAGMGRETPA